MRKNLLVSVVVAFFLFCTAGQVLAIGLGGYLEAAGGDGDFEYESSPEFDVDVAAAGLGFVLDTDLTDNGVFNYRLNVGFESLDLDDDFDDTLELGGLVVANTFGFAIIRQPNFRWWAGPQIRVGFYNGEVDIDPDTDYDLVSFGIGGVMGVNFMAGNVCFSTSLGLLATEFTGEADGPGYNEDIDGSTTTAFLNFAVMFGN